MPQTLDDLQTAALELNLKEQIKLAQYVLQNARVELDTIGAVWGGRASMWCSQAVDRTRTVENLLNQYRWEPPAELK